MTPILNNSSTNYKTLRETQSTDTSATFSGPPSSSISSSRVLGGRSSDNLSKRSRRSLFMIWALSTASWLVTELSWLSALTAQKTTTLAPHLRAHVCILEEATSPGAGVLGGLTGAVKEGLVELRPEANKALWIESGSILFRLFFFFSFPFLGSFLMSQGSEGGKEKSCCRNTSTGIILTHKSYRLPHHHQTHLWMGWNHHPRRQSWQIWSCRHCQTPCPSPLTHLSWYPRGRRACGVSSSAAS